MFWPLVSTTNLAASCALYGVKVRLSIYLFFLGTSLLPGRSRRSREHDSSEGRYQGKLSRSGTFRRLCNTSDSDGVTVLVLCLNFYDSMVW